MYRMIVQGNTSVEFEFKLVRTGTTSPILAEEVVLSILDVDAEMVESMHSYRMMCAVSAKGFSAQVHGDAIRKLNDNFYALADGSPGNPSSSFGLPPKQKAQGVALKYKDVSQWTIVFTIYNKGVSTAAALLDVRHSRRLRRGRAGAGAAPVHRRQAVVLHPGCAAGRRALRSDVSQRAWCCHRQAQGGQRVHLRRSVIAAAASRAVAVPQRAASGAPAIAQ